ncbi:hypothetical protein BKA70DRAFT_87059 [Coprinopsis sp. MPI-PUGE-AT-0042]|nr:hypothetical protein BKA70DRAFT_87059 [Coprinopsis sp. MPI-PUGE-AT-0042]
MILADEIAAVKSSIKDSSRDIRLCLNLHPTSKNVKGRTDGRSRFAPSSTPTTRSAVGPFVDCFVLDRCTHSDLPSMGFASAAKCQRAIQSRATLAQTSNHLQRPMSDCLLSNGSEGHSSLSEQFEGQAGQKEWQQRGLQVAGKTQTPFAPAINTTWLITTTISQSTPSKPFSSGLFNPMSSSLPLPKEYPDVLNRIKHAEYHITAPSRPQPATSATGGDPDTLLGSTHSGRASCSSSSTPPLIVKRSTSRMETLSPSFSHPLVWTTVWERPQPFQVPFLLSKAWNHQQYQR